MISSFFNFLIITINCFVGLLAYAYYYNCDVLRYRPDREKQMKSEQILPDLVINIFGDIEGLSGLFVAMIYSAALSTISSGMNALASVTISDFAKPYMLSAQKIKNQNYMARLTRILGSFFL